MVMLYAVDVLLLGLVSPLKPFLVSGSLLSSLLPLVSCSGTISPTLSVSVFQSFIFFHYFDCQVYCSLENWYYRILILMTGNLQNAKIAVDALSIWYVSLDQSISTFTLTSKFDLIYFHCFPSMSINGWEMMIPLAFFAGVGYVSLTFTRPKLIKFSFIKKGTILYNLNRQLYQCLSLL